MTLPVRSFCPAAKNSARTASSWFHCRRGLALLVAGAVWLSAGVAMAAKPVRVEQAVAVFRAGEPIPILVDLPEKSGEGDRILSWKVRDWKGTERLADSLHLPAKILSGATVLLQDLPPGWYEAEFACDGVVLGKQRLITGEYYKSQGAEFRYGICAHLMRVEGEESRKTNELLKSLGADIVRIEISWGSVQAGKDAPFKFEQSDAILLTMQKLGLDPAILLDYGVSWATTAPASIPYADHFRYAPQIDPWLGYVRAMVGRYGKTTRYWEVWNEPDIGFWRSSVEQYLELFQRTADEVARLDPHAQIMNGGMAMVSRPPNNDFLPRFMAGADRAHWSIFAIHDYMTTAEWRQRYEMAMELMRQNHLSLPVWINEGGFHTLMPGGETAQAVILVKKLSLSAAFGVKSYFWYDLRDDGTLAGETEHHFGLTGHDFQPKPAFAAYRQMICAVADRPVLASVAGKDDDFCVITYGPRKQGPNATGGVSLVWKEARGPAEPVWIGSESPNDTLHLTDVMGAPVGKEFAGGALVFVGSDPLYVESKQGAKIRLQRVLKLPSRLIVSSDNRSLSIPITNPLPGKTTVAAELQWRAKDGQVTGIASPWKGELEVGQTRAAEFVVDDQLLARLSANGEGAGELALRLGDNPAVQTVALTMESPQKVGSGPASWKAELGDRSFIRNLHEGEPDPALHWSGPADLSARATASWEDGPVLRLVVEVRDDIHAQNFDAAALWKGDSLQLVLAPLEKPEQFVEMTLGLVKSGKAEGFINRAPAGCDLKAGPLPESLPVSVERNGDVTRYDIRIPLAAAGLKDAFKSAFLLDFLVNDDDGKGRKQWVHYTPGIGEEKNPRLFRSFILQSSSTP